MDINIISEIADKLKERLAEELKNHIPKKAIGYLNLDANIDKFILVNAQPNIKYEDHGKGLVIITGPPLALKNGVSRNSELVRHIFKYESIHESNEFCKTTVNTIAEYTPHNHEVEIYNGFIESLIGGKMDFRSRSLFDRLSELLEVSRKEKEVQKRKEKILEDEYQNNESSIEELYEINNQLKDLKEKRSQRREELQKFGRITVSLKSAFALKGTQDEALINNLLQGPLIINGGPGTGKTTILIHKLQYLKDFGQDGKQLMIESLPEANIKLSEDERKFILDPYRGWVFFSPNELLRNYLKDAMASEGLTATKETVRIWDVHRTLLWNEFQVSKFFSLSTEGEELFNLSAGKFTKINIDFDKYLLDHFYEKVHKRLDEEVPIDFRYFKEISLIQKNLKDYIEGKPKTIYSLVNTLLSLDKENFLPFPNKDSKESSEGFKELFSTSKKILDKKFKDIFSNLTNFSDKGENGSNEDPIKGYEESNEDFKELFLSTKTVVDKSFKNIIAGLIYSLKQENIFNKALKLNGSTSEAKLSKTLQELIANEIKVDLGKTKTNTKHKPLLDLLRTPYLTFLKNGNNYKTIKEGWFIRNFINIFFEKDESFLLNDIYKCYASFRRDMLIKQDYLSSNGRNKLISIINQKDSKKALIHTEEVDFVIYHLFRLIRIYYSASQDHFFRTQRGYIKKYRGLMRGVVAVDEATDFTLVQLSCMALLTHPRFNCVVLVGDEMQKLEERGINGWKEFQQIFPSTNREDLTVSFRQTPTLLSVASKLYKNRNKGEKIEYTSRIEQSDVPPPKPLVYIDNDINNQITWLTDRIIEIYEIYDDIIPNMAVFVKSDDEVTTITKKINSIKSLNFKNIKAESCIGEETLGNAEHIRVFNIKRIKGLEFEAVFFLNLDDYQGENQSLLDRYIYVGISRASVFLGVTLKHSFPESIKCIEDSFYKETWLEKIEGESPDQDMESQDSDDFDDFDSLDF